MRPDPLLPALFTPFTVRSLALRNRIVVSPMCQYSAEGGLPNAWHLVHLGSRAVGGASLVMTEATSVTAVGRISPWDLGLWADAQVAAFRPIVAFVKEQGAAAGVQLAHAGRKASTDKPWRGGGTLQPERGGWEPVAPSPIAYSPDHPVPHELSGDEIDGVVSAFAEAARRAVACGFDVVELHMAHGYLLHQFLSPLSNRRSDAYGGPFDNRLRLPLRVVEEVRRVWGDRPLFVRMSVTDWAEGGWDLEASIEFAKRLKAKGADLVDCSSGGLVPGVRIPAGPGYQVPFAAAIRSGAGIATGAVGLIVDPHQAEQIVSTGQADLVLLARAFLRDPYWTMHAADALRAEHPWPPQYLRAKP